MNNMTMFLTAEEVAILTGRSLKSKQIAHLRKIGIAFQINATGHPVVLRSAIEPRTRSAVAPIKVAWVPNVMRLA